MMRIIKVNIPCTCKVDKKYMYHHPAQQGCDYSVEYTDKL